MMKRLLGGFTSRKNIPIGSCKTCLHLFMVLFDALYTGGREGPCCLSKVFHRSMIWTSIHMVSSFFSVLVSFLDF